MTILLFAFSSLVILLDLNSIYYISKKIYNNKQKYLDKKLLLRYRLIISFSIWAFRNLLFMYLCLIPWSNSLIINIIAKILFIIPTTIFLFLTLRNLIVNIKKIKIKNLTFYLIFIPIYTLLIFAGETAFDSFAYHIPIELLLRDSGSLWNWPDLIFTQWGLIGGDITNSLYHFAFDSPRIGSVSSISIVVYLILLAFTLSNLKLTVFFIISILSIPSFLGQVNSRYVDTLLAVVLFTIYLFIKDTITKKRNGFNLIILVILVSFSVSIKLSAIPVLFFIFIYLIVLIYKEKFVFNKNVIFKHCLIYFLGFFLGLFPIFFRNLIEFNNPLMPFYIKNSNLGIIDITKFSRQIDQSYAQILGLQEKSSYSVGFYQYISSPFDFYKELIIELLNHKKFNLEFLKSQNEFFSIFTYDNRIGGYGVITIIIVLLLLSNFNKYSLTFLISLLVFFPILPGIIHPRYSLAYILIALWIIATNYNLNLRLKNKVIYLVTVFVLGISMFFNTYAFYERTFNNGVGFYQFDRHQFTLSKWVNPDCKKVLHFGIGLWSGTAFWGPNFCGEVISSKIINGAILSYKIGPEKLSKGDVNSLKYYVEAYKDQAIIVCTLRWNEITEENDENYLPTLCDDLKSNLVPDKNYVFEFSEYINDNFQGPKIQKITIKKVGDIK